MSDAFTVQLLETGCYVMQCPQSPSEINLGGEYLLPDVPVCQLENQIKYQLSRCCSNCAAVDCYYHAIQMSVSTPA